MKQRHILGKVVANIYVIEFQKRGLAHSHHLIWLCNDDKLRTAEDINRLISAEIPDPLTQPRLHEVIVANNIHGPCVCLIPIQYVWSKGNAQRIFLKII